MCRLLQNVVNQELLLSPEHTVYSGRLLNVDGIDNKNKMYHPVYGAAVPAGWSRLRNSLQRCSRIECCWIFFGGKKRDDRDLSNICPVYHDCFTESW